MAPLNLETLKTELTALTPEQKRELREWWDAQETPKQPLMTAAELQRKLLAVGIIRHVPPPITDFTPLPE